MKHEFIEANTLEDAWFLTLYRMIDEGRVHKIDRGSFAGQKRLEFDYVTIQIKNPGKGNLIPKIPEVYNIDNPVAEGYCESYSQQYLMGHELAENEVIRMVKELLDIQLIIQFHCLVMVNIKIF